MANEKWPNEKLYQDLADALNALSSTGESLLLHSNSHSVPSEISGFNGSVRWNFETRTWRVVNYDD